MSDAIQMLLIVAILVFEVPYEEDYAPNDDYVRNRDNIAIFLEISEPNTSISLAEMQYVYSLGIHSNLNEAPEFKKLIMCHDLEKVQKMNDWFMGIMKLYHELGIINSETYLNSQFASADLLNIHTQVKLLDNEQIPEMRRRAIITEFKTQYAPYIKSNSTIPIIPHWFLPER